MTRPLPGGDMPDADFDRFLAELAAGHAWLPPDLARRYARAYGTRTLRLLGGATGLDGLGEHLGDGLYEAEVDYLVRHEWAASDDDILWRRSKLALHVSDATAARLRAWLGLDGPVRQVAAGHVRRVDSGRHPSDLEHNPVSKRGAYQDGRHDNANADSWPPPPAVAVLAFAGPSQADMAAAERWIDEEFQPSTLSRDEQLAEMEWFIKAAEPFAGMEINVLSETIPTHTYESEVLTRAFEEITGIKVNHQLLGEGEVVQAVQTQMQTNRNLYDAYINDSDLIGTHSRLQSAVNLTDWMAGEGADVTNPDLDVDDFIGKSFTTGPDGKLWQLPDQQFANLYWFRKDWFDREDLQAQFKEKYGYDLGVPVDWSAYEDIAEFFTNDVQGDRRRPRLRPHGLRQARARPRLAHDRRLAVDGRLHLEGPAERPADRRVGHPHGGGLLQPGGRLGLARRRRQRAGLGLRHPQVGRVAAAVRASGRGRPRLLPVAAGALARATSPSRSSGTRRSCPTWSSPRARATTPSTTRAICCGAWRPRRTGPTGKRA